MGQAERSEKGCVRPAVPKINIDYFEIEEAGFFSKTSILVAGLRVYYIPSHGSGATVPRNEGH